ELVMFYYFSEPARYKDLASAAAPIPFSCFPLRTSLNGTDKSLHWYQSGMAEINTMAQLKATRDAVATRMASIETTLRGIPELAGVAKSYTPTEIAIGDLIHD